ncbi:MAG: hypothetical protein ACE5GS_14915 [Kiloniellaceae bacterium]
MAGMKRRELAEKDRRLNAATLGEVADQGVDVFCWCNRCGHNAVLAAADLIGDLGGGYPVPEVGARLRCSRCGGKDVATRPAWPSLGQVARHG